MSKLQWEKRQHYARIWTEYSASITQNITVYATYAPANDRWVAHCNAITSETSHDTQEEAQAAALELAREYIKSTMQELEAALSILDEIEAAHE